MKPNEPRGFSSKFDESKAKKIYGLLKKGAFEIILEKDVSKKSNVLEGHFELAVKNPGTDEDVWKVRFVLQIHTDTEKNTLVNASSNVRQQTA